MRGLPVLAQSSISSGGTRMRWVCERWTKLPEGGISLEVVAMFEHYDDAWRWCEMKCSEGELTKVRPNK